jgi:hypothetical protein
MSARVVRAWTNAEKRLTIERNVIRCDIANQRDIPDTHLIEAFDGMCVCLQCVFQRHAHVVVSSWGIKFDAYAIRTPNLDKNFDDFKKEPGAILSTPAPFVGAFV